MKKTGIAILVLVLVGAGLWSYRTGEAQSAAATPPMKIAVVNVAEVLTQCRENLDREKEGQDRREKIKGELEKLAAEADTIKEELQNALQPGTDEFSERRREWFYKQAQLQALQESEKEALTIDSQAWTEKLYEKLLDQIKSLALQEGYVMVLNQDEADMKGRKLQELYNLILTRKMLYCAPTLDITAQVLQNMDTAYEREKTSKKK